MKTVVPGVTANVSLTAVAPPPGLNEEAWNRWLQNWLNAHGAQLVADGDLGPMSRDALAAYLVKHA